MPNDLFALGDMYDSGDDDSGDADWSGATYDSGAEVGDIVGDIVGDDQLAGDIVGALARRGLIARRPAAPARGRQLARPQARPQPLGPYNPRSPRVEYTPFKPTKTRRYMLGFTKSVALSATDVVTNQPQLPFRPERIIVPSTVGGNFSLIDLKIGNKSQLVASGGVPALTFSEQAVGTDVGLDTASISQTITFTVQNLDSAAAHVFQATLLGTAMDNLAFRLRDREIRHMFRPRFVIRAFIGKEDPVLSGKILRALLDAQTSINMEIMKDELADGRRVPLLYQSGIRYVRDGESENPEYGSEDWQDVLEANHRKQADCKTLACYRAAELQLQGIKAFAQFRWRDRDRGSLYHIIVQHPDGTIEDPSALLGMYDRRHHLQPVVTRRRDHALSHRSHSRHRGFHSRCRDDEQEVRYRHQPQQPVR